MGILIGKCLATVINTCTVETFKLETSKNLIGFINVHMHSQFDINIYRLRFYKNVYF